MNMTERFFAAIFLNNARTPRKVLPPLNVLGSHQSPSVSRPSDNNQLF